MSHVQAELVLDARNGTGESPVWNVREEALYWVDIPWRRLHRWQPGGATQCWEAPQMVACIAPRAGASSEWIAGLETGIFALTPQADGTLSINLIAPVEHAMTPMRFNDGRCDRQGRLWAGTMALDMAGAHRVGRVYRFDGASSSPVAAQFDDFIVPNGLAFSPDGRTMYLSDSHPVVQKVWAFDYDTDTGTPTNRRLFADMQPLPGRPDGAAIDTDGCYWICGNDAGLVHRFTPDGKLDRSLAVPVKKPAMCAFGGANLDTLYVTSIRPDNIDLSDQPLAGGVFALRPGAQGVPEPEAVL
jgi:sugar lactone lactonase YvrE